VSLQSARLAAWWQAVAAVLSQQMDPLVRLRLL
jgi:hypothetical protein